MASTENTEEERLRSLLKQSAHLLLNVTFCFDWTKYHEWGYQQDYVALLELLSHELKSF